VKKLKRYFDRWSEIETEIRKKKGDIVNTPDIILYTSFINKLNDSEMFEFLEDTLRGGSPESREIFTKLSDVHRDAGEVALDYLSKTPVEIVKNRMTPAIDKIFANAIDNKYDDSPLVIRTIKTLTVLRKAGLSEDKIINTVMLRPDISVSIRIELLHLLSKIEDGIAGYSFWKLLSEKFDQQPYMAAGFIEALKKNHPEEAIGILLRFNDIKYKPDIKDELPYFITSTESALENLLKNADKISIEKYLVFYNQIRSEWVKKIIDDIIHSYRFGPIYKKISEVSNTIAKSSMTKLYDDDGLPFEPIKDRVAWISSFNPQSKS